MKRSAILTAIAVLFAAPSFSQNASIRPLQIPAGAIVNFELQSRLNPSASDPADALPAGTKMQVKILDNIDSRVDRDGSSFQGILVSPLEQDNRVVLGANAQVNGLLALLRSRQHPEGFKYELLVTNVVDGGRSYVVTASLDPSSFEPTATKTAVRASMGQRAADQN